jgi:hypothetical protein
MTNTGLLEATGGGTLVLDGGTFTNTGATITAGSGSMVKMDGGAVINGGAVSDTGTGGLQLAGATINAPVTNSSTGTLEVVSGTTNTIGTLTNSAGGQVKIYNNSTLTLTGPSNVNAGTIAMNSVGNNTDLILGSAAVTLTGGGTVTLSNNGNNFIYGAVGSDVLTNVNNTIQGSGQIGDGQMGLVNQGTIDANQSTPLTIRTSNGTTNTGTLEATAGGNLILNGDTYTDASGTILASGAGSVVTFESPTIKGGTLNTASGGLIQASGDPTLNGVTNKGTYQLSNNNSTTLVGTMTNNGSIQLNSVGNNTNLYASGGVTLAGGGTVTMSDNNNNNLEPVSSGGGSLTNVNNTISGSGYIYNMAFTNQAGGVVNATSAAGSDLTIQTNTFGATNLGLMEASSGGTLQLENAIVNTNGTTNGTIEALNGGTVVLNGATVSGGTITTAGTGVVIAENGPTLDCSTHTITNGGNLQVPNNTPSTTRARCLLTPSATTRLWWWRAPRLRSKAPARSSFPIITAMQSRQLPPETSSLSTRIFRGRAATSALATWSS